jgi:hypothetical protein
MRRHGAAYTWRDGHLIDGNCLGPEWEDIENHAGDIWPRIAYSQKDVGIISKVS